MAIRETHGKQKVIAIVGPTASGKSALGVFLASKVRGEIISADSRQVYRGLNIGTGKISKKEMAGVPHHLLDVVSPKKTFSVDDFVKQATKVCSSILQKTKMPIVVGGTGFYVDALLGRITLPHVPPNPKLREQLEKKSVEKLFAMLQKLDPKRAKTIEPKHKRRLIRAIEIAKALGRSPTASPSQTRRSLIEDLPAATYNVLWLGLNPAPQQLKKNIHTRLLTRIKAGMLNEAKRLHGQGLSYKRMEELGLEYRYMARLLQNKITKGEFLVELEREINKYAKRQMRWFKRNKDIHWIKNKSEALRLARVFLSR